jgi:hypothetical protein
MAENDTKKEVKKISAFDIFGNFISRTLDQIQDGIGPTKFLVIVLVIVIGLPLIWLFATAGTGESEKEMLPADVQEFENKNEARYTSPRKLNEPVTIDRLTWTFLSVEDKGTTLAAQTPEMRDCKAPEKKKFIVARATVKSELDKDMMLKNPPLYNTKDTSVGTFLNAPLCIKELQDDGFELFGNQTITKGEEKKLLFVYAIAEDAKDMRLGVFDSEFLGVGRPKEVNYIGVGF